MKKRILLASERSAGHVYPALAFGSKIRENQEQRKIFYFTSSKFFKNYIEKNQETVFGLTFRFRNLLLEFSWRFFEAAYILFRVRPHLVIGFGGRDSFFLVLLGRFFTKEVFIYEPNARMGKANKILSFVVSKILRGIPPQDGNKKQKIIGVPLRKDIVRLKKMEVLEKLNFNQRPVVLCFGGSQGSTFINRNFIKFVGQCRRRDYQIIHLTGLRDYREADNFYQTVKNNKLIKDFYWDMPALYSIADLVVARAGALTLAHLSFYNIPAVLIPHPRAGGHQKSNADFLAKKEAAFSFSQDCFNFNAFNNCLEELIYNSFFRKTIKKNLEKIKLITDDEEFSFLFN